MGQLAGRCGGRRDGVVVEAGRGGPHDVDGERGTRGPGLPGLAALDMSRHDGERAAVVDETAGSPESGFR